MTRAAFAAAGREPFAVSNVIELDAPQLRATGRGERGRRSSWAEAPVPRRAVLQQDAGARGTCGPPLLHFVIGSETLQDRVGRYGFDQHVEIAHGFAHAAKTARHGHPGDARRCGQVAAQRLDILRRNAQLEAAGRGGMRLCGVQDMALGLGTETRQGADTTVLRRAVELLHGPPVAFTV